MAAGRSDDERWFSVADVVRHRNISERTLRAAIASGELRVVRLAGLRRGPFKAVRIPASALEAWLAPR